VYLAAVPMLQSQGLPRKVLAVQSRAMACGLAQGTARGRWNRLQCRLLGRCGLDTRQGPRQLSPALQC